MIYSFDSMKLSFAFVTPNLSNTRKQTFELNKKTKVLSKQNSVWDDNYKKIKKSFCRIDVHNL